MNLFWLSWKDHANFSDLELHWPWWTTGSGDDYRTICALIMAEDETSACEVIYEAYDERPTDIRFRFVEQRDLDFVRELLGLPGAPILAVVTGMEGEKTGSIMHPSRFQLGKWMPNLLDPAFDPVAWTRKQEEAVAAAKVRHADVLARNEIDRETLSSEMPAVVLRSAALSLAEELIGEAMSKARNTEISSTEIMEECLDRLAAELAIHPGYVTMAERELSEFKIGTYILADGVPSQIYLKTELGNSVALDGSEPARARGDTRIIPIRLVGTPPVRAV